MTRTVTWPLRWRPPRKPPLDWLGPTAVYGWHYRLTRSGKQLWTPMRVYKLASGHIMLVPPEAYGDDIFRTPANITFEDLFDLRCWLTARGFLPTE